MPMDGSAGFHREFHLPARQEEIAVLRQAVSEMPELPVDFKMNLHVMIEEIFVNICSYAYPEGEGTVDVMMDVGDRVTLVFRDSGKPFDPTKDIPDMEEYDIMNAIGGVGRFITFRLADAYSYEYTDGQNVLRLEKMCPH